MNEEKYKRFVIRELIGTEYDEDSIDIRLNEKAEIWKTEMIQKHPGFKCRILNAETCGLNTSELGFQSMPPTIRYSLHMAYITGE
ncbi:MAG: hypothetical protein ABI390_11795 [Daejeonella sp.]